MLTSEQLAWLEKNEFVIHFKFGFATRHFPRAEAYRNPEARRLGREARTQLGWKSRYTHQSACLTIWPEQREYTWNS